MTTEDEAVHAAGLLIGSIGGFTEDAAKVFIQQLEKHTEDGEALIEVCDRMSTTWAGKFRPSLGEILDEYRQHPRVAAEREARATATATATAIRTGATHCDGTRWIAVDGGFKPCPRCHPYLADLYADRDKWNDRYRAGVQVHELHPQVTMTHGQMHPEIPLPPPCKTDTRYDPERIPGHDEGMALRNDAYRAVTGRNIGEDPVPSPVLAAEIIQRLGHFDLRREVWMTTYATVLGEFGGDQARTRVSLKALGARLTHANNGNLTLSVENRVSESPASYKSPRAPSAAEPSPPPDRPLSATDIVSEAIGATRRLITESEGGDDAG